VLATRLRFVLFALLAGLLLNAVTVHAECAWVLWEDTSWTKNNKSSTEPVRAYTTKPECDRAVSDALAAFTSSAGVVVKKDARLQEAYVVIGKSTTAYRYTCLPDTVDPRAPKGK